MKYCLKILFLFIFILSATWLFSQRGSATIKGKVVDAATGKIMEYCTVSLFEPENEVPANGIVSDFDGLFVLDDVKPGTYRLEVSFIGFQTKTVNDIEIDKNTTVKDLGTIALSADEKQLAEVEISTTRSTVKYEIDKKVVSVDKQLVATNGNATDVLATVPSVQVDIDGNVKLRGKSSFQVLINGRPSVLEASEALQQIPASEIENIEIITNPSAKYDAEGSAGIINIILKKERASGFSGVINARYGTFKNYGTDATLSYNLKKVTFTFTGNFNQRRMPNEMNVLNTNTINGTSYTTESFGEKTRAFKNGNVKAGLEYRMSEKSTFNLEGSYGLWGMDVDDTRDFVLTQGGIITDTYSNVNDTERRNNYFRFAGNYNFKINDKSEITFHAAYNQSDFREEVLNFQERVTTVFDGSKSTEQGPSSRFRGNIDYVYRFNENAKFEFGFLQELDKSDEESRYFDYEPANEIYVDEPAFNQGVLYESNIRAFYGMYANKYKKLGYQIGLRSEFTDRNITQSGSSVTTTIKRTDLFPSVYLSYDIKEGNQVFLNYSKRIRRPRGWYLEPNIIYLDANTLWRGNPEILPQYIHSFEAGWMKYIGDKGSYNTQAYYMFEQNSIEFVSTPYSENETLEEPKNVGNIHFFGIEQSLQYRMFKWWEVMVGMDLAYFKVDGQIDGLDIDSKNVSGRGNISNFFTLTKSTKLQFDFRYEGRQRRVQGFNAANYGFNLGARQTFLDNSLTLGLQFNDLFNTLVWEGTTELPNIYFRQTNDRLYPQIVFSASYRINNFRNKRSVYDEDGGGEF